MFNRLRLAALFALAAVATPLTAQSTTATVSSATTTKGVAKVTLTLDSARVVPSKGMRVLLTIPSAAVNQLRDTIVLVRTDTIRARDTLRIVVHDTVQAPTTAPNPPPLVAPTPPTPVDTASPSVAPLVLEDFSTYTSTAQLLANPRGIWATVEAKNTSRITLDTLSYGASNRSMRYDWPTIGASCQDYSIKPGMLLIPGKLTHVWVEFVVRFSPNFAVNAGASGCGAEYKLASLGDYSHGVGRWNVPEMQADQFNVGAPWVGSDLTIDKIIAPSTLWDGKPHVFRIEAALGIGKPTGIFRFWVDGRLHASQTGFTTDPSHQVIDIFGPGLNINQGPSVAGMQMWWHRIAIYATNPGW